MPIHASTILARSPKSILSYISSFPKHYSDHTLLFAISPNLNPSDLSDIVDSLTNFSKQSAGCLSRPVPTVSDLISCSVAIFDQRDSVIFRSTIPGKPSTQVGRWHAFREKDDISPLKDTLPEGNVNWQDIWSRNTGHSPLPPELLELNPKEIDSVIYFSDIGHEGLSNSFAGLPYSTKLGLLASSTPFITGRPVTLFHNSKIYSSGAVGVALTGRKSTPIVDFQGLRPITPAMVVTRSKGNMVNEIDNGNPTRILLSALRNNSLTFETNVTSKDDENFYLGAVLNGVVQRIYHITAGDPSRGSISLDSSLAPADGTQVQFFHRPTSIPVEVPENYRNHPSSQAFAFINSSDRSGPNVNLKSDVDPAVNFASSATTIDEQESATQVLTNVFLASSENGFVLSRSARGVEAPWKCTVPGGLAGLEWPAS